MDSPNDRVDTSTLLASLDTELDAHFRSRRSHDAEPTTPVADPRRVSSVQHLGEKPLTALMHGDADVESIVLHARSGKESSRTSPNAVSKFGAGVSLTFDDENDGEDASIISDARNTEGSDECVRTRRGRKPLSIRAPAVEHNSAVERVEEPKAAKPQTTFSSDFFYAENTQVTSSLWFGSGGVAEGQGVDDTDDHEETVMKVSTLTDSFQHLGGDDDALQPAHNFAERPQSAISNTAHSYYSALRSAETRSVRMLCKIRYGEEMYFVGVPVSVSFYQFYLKVYHQCIGEEETSATSTHERRVDLHIRYRDRDNDLITVRNDVDLRTCFEYWSSVPQTPVQPWTSTSLSPFLSPTTATAGLWSPTTPASHYLSLSASTTSAAHTVTDIVVRFEVTATPKQTENITRSIMNESIMDIRVINNGKNAKAGGEAQNRSTEESGEREREKVAGESVGKESESGSGREEARSEKKTTNSLEGEAHSDSARGEKSASSEKRCRSKRSVLHLRQHSRNSSGTSFDSDDSKSGSSTSRLRNFARNFSKYLRDSVKSSTRRSKSAGESEREKDKSSVREKDKPVSSTPLSASSASTGRFRSDSDSSSASTNHRVGKWQIGERLGTGAYGSVYLALSVTTGQLFAVKQVRIPKGNAYRDSTVKALQKEIDMLKSLKEHVHVVKYLGTEFNEEERILNIFMEYMPGGSIQSLISRFGVFSESLIRVYTRQILQGLAFLHSNNIIHLDIKGANILVDDKGNVKLADFGAAKRIQALTNPNAVSDTAYKPYFGTIPYMAPEIVRQETPVQFGADIWSLACTVIEMRTGRPPWPMFSTEDAAIWHIGNARGPPELPAGLSVELRDFLSRCYSVDRNKRWSANEALMHPFIQGKKFLLPPRASLTRLDTVSGGAIGAMSTAHSRMDSCNSSVMSNEHPMQMHSLRSTITSISMHSRSSSAKSLTSFGSMLSAAGLREQEDQQQGIGEQMVLTLHPQAKDGDKELEREKNEMDQRTYEWEAEGSHGAVCLVEHMEWQYNPLFRQWKGNPLWDALYGETAELFDLASDTDSVNDDDGTSTVNHGVRASEIIEYVLDRQKERDTLWRMYRQQLGTDPSCQMASPSPTKA